jgi:hypothetical protein
LRRRERRGFGRELDREEAAGLGEHRLHLPQPAGRTRNNPDLRIAPYTPAFWSSRAGSRASLSRPGLVSTFRNVQRTNRSPTLCSAGGSFVRVSSISSW